MRHKSQILPAVFLTLFLGILVFQAAQTWRSVIRPWLYANRGFVLASAPQRGAMMYMGPDLARYVRFLQAYLPEDASLVIPADFVFLSSQNIMQNYLFPRPILKCGQRRDSAAMEACLADARNFVVAAGDFPPAERVPGRVLVHYPDSHGGLDGVYVPEGRVDQLPVPDRAEYGKTAPITVGAIVIDLLTLGLFFALGCLIVFVVLGRPAWLDFLELSIPLAMGFLSWCLFILSYLGFKIDLRTVGLLYLFLLGLAGASFHWLYRSAPRMPAVASRAAISAWMRERKPALILLLVLLGGVMLMGGLSVANGYSDFDSIANWSFKGYAMAGKGTIWAGADWGGHILSYPMNLALSIAIFKLADGDVIPGSKFLYVLLTLALLAGCYRFLSRRGVGQVWILLGLLGLLTTTVFFENALSGLANLPFSVYLVLGILNTLEGLDLLDIRRVTLGGLLLGFAAWTRPEGILFATVFLVLMYALAILLLQRRPRPRFWVASFLPALIIPLLWLTLIGRENMEGDQIGQAIRAFTGQALRGNWGLEGLALLWGFAWKSLLDVSKFGLILGAALLLILLCIPLTRWPRDRFRSAFIALTTLAFLLPAGMFFVAYFREANFIGFLQQSFNRAYLPALTMSVLAAILALTHQKESSLPVPGEGGVRVEETGI
jgi:hypothetical protein